MLLLCVIKGLEGTILNVIYINVYDISHSYKEVTLHRCLKTLANTKLQGQLTKIIPQTTWIRHAGLMINV